jgi:hypothetical protein
MAASAAAALEFTFARLRGRTPQVTPASVRMMYDSWACNSDRARAEIGYTYRPLLEGLRQTLSSMSTPAARPTDDSRYTANRTSP